MWKRILIGVAGVAVVAVVGLLLGLWLSRHAPVEPAAEDAPPPARVRAGDAPVAAADSQDFVPEAPQPRLDGSRGVPSHSVPNTQPVPLVSAMDHPVPDVPLSTVAPDEDALRQQADGTGSGTAVPDVPAVVTTSAQGGVATVDAAGPSGATGAASPADENVPGWVQGLRTEIQKCSGQGAVNRAICAEQVRFRVCGANNGWGVVPDCPRTGNN